MMNAYIRAEIDGPVALMTGTGRKWARLVSKAMDASVARSRVQALNGLGFTAEIDWEQPAEPVQGREVLLRQVQQTLAKALFETTAAPILHAELTRAGYHVESLVITDLEDDEFQVKLRLKHRVNSTRYLTYRVKVSDIND